MKMLGIGLIRVYRKVLSPFFAGSCRYEPSCSVYTEQAIEKYGLFRGSWKGAKRVGQLWTLATRRLRPVE